ncbi:beta-L-arabinofuranosidase domain-containing protein [Saccharicrinis sp. FJH62]|uniref:glycoside hydrolase family 127 protein n=1 Tax=Saccharicrinis sp. FJH62 TaxID=3344657 RepID=UPI0035D49E39
MKKLNSKHFMAFAGVVILLVFFSSCKTEVKTEKEGQYPIEPVPFTSVHVTDQFWAPKIKINHNVTIPIAIEQSEISGRVKNFEIAAGDAKGEFCSEYPFDDSDIYKIIEAASYSLQTMPDSALQKKLDELIEKIRKAQEEDGYIYTNLTIAEKNGTNPHPWVGDGRWNKVHELSHELYNLGHMFEAAVAHYQATGQRNFLDIAIKAADMLDRTFGWGKLEDYPGHQVVEMGLVKLYRATNEKRYLDLAKFFLDVRGPGGSEYNQAHEKVVDQTRAVGHAVRATYMYSGMADIAALYNDESYLHASRAIWQDMVYGKTYVTGGIGASGGNEGFDEPYNLPNMAAYCETCASIGDVFWNYRLFLSDGEAKYMDVLERTLYNALISGVSLTGDRFFYPNVLESIGQHSRSKWFGCACCPPNIARLLPSLPGYVYAKTNDAIYINLYMSNTAQIKLGDEDVTISQETQYPWNGLVKMTINPENKARFALKLRIPGWARNEAIPGDLYTFMDGVNPEVTLNVNGKDMKVKPEHGYVTIDRKWTKGDVVSLNMPMEPREVKADENIKADADKMAIQRGPLMYAAEWPDVEDGKVLNLIFDKDKELTVEHNDHLLNGVYTINIPARIARATKDGGLEYSEEKIVKLIPYYAWNNRGPGEMAVWLPYNEKSVRPLPAPSIASKSKLSASRPTKSLIAINDQLMPKDANDHTWPYYHWWPENNAWEWVQYDFDSEETVNKVKVYWFDDGPFGGCRIPAEWKVMYKSGKNWVPVKTLGQYTITKDSWDSVNIEPVKTTALRMMVKLPERFSTGIHEWVIE